jgi:hypothetical protein
MNQTPVSFGFKLVPFDPWAHIGETPTEEYRSSIDINPCDGIDTKAIIPDAAVNLVYRAEQFIKLVKWGTSDVSFVLTLTITPGKNQHSKMTLKQEKD